ncbi:MAG: LysR family transcriptional regulator [Clostridia bacterium]|nr:LysR family transcriptional regulator [Clostridia bacterium]
MDLKTLSYFVTVAEELNISRAAKKLNLSQPPLSLQIKNLEEELNTKLFIRGRRQLEITESGELLYRRAKEILNLVGKAESEVLSMNDGMTGTISLGLVEGMAPDFAGSWFYGFSRIYPRVRFRILDGNSDDLLEKLRSGIISLAVITSPYDQSLLNAFPVGRDTMAAMMSRDHPLAKEPGDTLSIKQLLGQPLIVPSRKATIDSITKWFREFKREPNIICEMDSYLDAAALAGRGMGISIFPETSYILNSSIVSKKIDGPDRDLDYLFVWRKGHPLPTIEEKFIDYVKEQTRL